MPKRFRVALSFSGQKRDYVSQVAGGLADLFGQDSVLYDKYHVAEFARPDLATYLPTLYYNECDLVVVVFCPGYDTSEWCGLEWRAITGLIKQGKMAEVMLCRFDLIEPPDLFGLGGFVDLDNETPAGLASTIVKRLDVNKGGARPSDSAPAPLAPGWPSAPPTLDWSVADHTDARRGFAELITSASPFRLLLIEGETNTGKSHLTNQFLRNGAKIGGLTCGRFDFKGSSDMDAELQGFAERLGVPQPAPGTSVSRQLAAIFTSLKKAARPTLLVFDTFEWAGEAGRWIKDNLLWSLVGADWLRVIIVGQRVPSPIGQAWEGVARAPITLRPPTPEEWFEFGKPFNSKPEFTLELVGQVYALTNGNSSFIAQLCQPAGARDESR